MCRNAKLRQSIAMRSSWSPPALRCRHGRAAPFGVLETQDNQIPAIDHSNTKLVGQRGGTNVCCASRSPRFFSAWRVRCDATLASCNVPAHPPEGWTVRPQIIWSAQTNLIGSFHGQAISRGGKRITHSPRASGATLLVPLFYFGYPHCKQYAMDSLPWIQ